MTKNSVKNPIRTATKTRPSQRPGANPESDFVAASELVAALELVAVKESPSEDKECGEPHGYYQEHDRDRGRAIEIGLRAEREDVGKLIQRIVLGDGSPR